MNNLHTPYVLRLNANYMRLGWSTAAQAFCMLMGEAENGMPPALAIDVHYEYDEYGRPMFDNNPKDFDRVDWEYWMELEPRRGELDQVVHTSKRTIRIPTIIICAHFYLMPKKEQKISKMAIRRRDNNRCQYTGVELTNKTFSLDHIVPKSKGGKDDWENLVSCHKEINFKKANRFNHEAGLKLIKQPKAPKIIPLCNMVTGIHHPDHKWF